ncbi:hypothetical protein L1887_30311 [Cichorium endivia]|nr:hypothetical protein L1887_30311 [Cichorium endivia]
MTDNLTYHSFRESHSYGSIPTSPTTQLINYPSSTSFHEQPYVFCVLVSVFFISTNLGLTCISSRRYLFSYSINSIGVSSNCAEKEKTKRR